MVGLILQNQKIFIDGIDASGFTNQVALTNMGGAIENTTLGMTTKSRLPGILDVSCDIDGYFDGTQDVDLFSLLGSQITARPISICPNSTVAAGDVVYFFNAEQASYAYSGQIGKVFGWKLKSSTSSAPTSSSGSPLVSGQVIMPVTTVTTTAVSAGKNLGAVSATQSVYAALHVTAISGTATPTITMIVQSGTTSGFGAPVTRLTFPAITLAAGIQGAYQTAVGAITDTWWRASYTISGTTPSFTIALFVGIK